MNRTQLIRITILAWMFMTWSGSAVAREYMTQVRTVAAADSIRSLLFSANCFGSMAEYSRARAIFSELNPGVGFSGELVPGSTIRVPVFPKKTEREVCLPFKDQRVVRVEFEAGTGAEKIRIYLDGPVLPDMFLLNRTRPVRVVCDFDGALPLTDLPREIPSQGRLVRKIRVGHEDKPFRRARVVLEIEETLTGRIEQEFFEQESLFVITVNESTSE